MYNNIKRLKIKKMENNKTDQNKTIVNIESLVRLAIYLEGFKQGKGNLLPLGTQDLEELWNAIKFLQGDVRYSLKAPSL